MPVSVIVFGAVLACGLIVMAMTRSQWADELSRLGKQQQRMSAKNADDAESLVFVAEKQGYLAKLLALAGLESKHDQMKVSWVCTAIGTGLSWRSFHISSCLSWRSSVLSSDALWEPADSLLT